MTAAVNRLHEEDKKRTVLKESVKNLVYRKKKPLTEVKSYGQI